MFRTICKKTEKIINLSWVESSCSGSGGIGITFEKLLDIETNTLAIPDYGEIEIKTKLINKKTYISLFNATPDSYLFEIKRIRDNYGYPDSKNPSYKVFNISVYADKKIYIGKNLFAKLKIDMIGEKITLLIFDIYGNLVDSDCSWSFEMIREKVLRKLQYLFLVYGESMVENNTTYYRYLKYYCYKLKSFDSFIEALRIGNMRITFKIGVYREGGKRGQINDHGTSFDIKEDKIHSIYEDYKMSDDSI